MLKGDLSSTTLASVLIDLASDGATGSLTLAHPEGEEAQIFMRSGLVCGIHAPDRHADLGAKLVSSGILAPEALADAQEAQRTDLSSWNLGELLVHLGYVEQDVVQGFVTEQLHETLWDLMRWTEGSWRFRKNAKTREDVGPPLTVVDLLESLRERGYEWETIAEIVDSPTAVPVLSARGDGAPETTLDSDAWSMLCKIDGARTVAELATDCGYTLFEAGQVLVALVDAGLVDISEAGDDGGEDVYGSATALADALSGARNGSGNPGGNGSAPASTDDDALGRLARLASEVTTAQPGTTAPTTNPLQLDVMAAQLSGGANLTVPVSRKSGESFAAAMDRVAGTLADALGPPPAIADDDPSLIRRPRPKPAKRSDDDSIDLEEQRRRRRAAAAAELAQAQAAVETLRPDRRLDGAATDAPPRLVDLEAERARVAAREAEEASRHAAEGAAREAAERFAREVAEQAARIQLEQAEREARAAEDAARDQLAMAAEQAQRDAAQRAAEEAARLAAEQATAEEAAKRAAEEAARLAAERAAADEAARVAAEQLAAEKAAREAAEQAARAAADELAAEKAARAAEDAARADAAQAAAEEAARVAAEEAAAEEAARIAAAEEAARVAAEQAAAEEAAERAAAEEAARLAEEAARLAEEATRLAEEQAAAEREAQEAAQRRAAAEAAEAARAEQEAEARAALAAAQAEADARLEAERQAQEEAERVAAEAAAKAAAEEAERAALQEAIEKSQRSAEAAQAAAMLVDLHHTSEPEPEPAPVAEVEPEPEPSPIHEPIAASGDADTAALLRELSSLGLDESAPSSLAAATPPARPRPNPAADKKAKKKIGLFGL